MTSGCGVRLKGSQLEPPYGELAAMACFHGALNALVKTLVGPYHVRASIRGRIGVGVWCRCRCRCRCIAHSFGHYFSLKWSASRALASTVHRFNACASFCPNWICFGQSKRSRLARMAAILVDTTGSHPPPLRVGSWGGYEPLLKWL